MIKKELANWSILFKIISLIRIVRTSIAFNLQYSLSNSKQACFKALGFAVKYTLLISGQFQPINLQPGLNGVY
jgi:hypothetical protein